MLLRSSFRSLTIALLVIVGLAVLLPPSTARADSVELPFEMRFPQEVDKTTFHNDWGQRRPGRRRHTGTDLMATQKMVEVYAIADGVVSSIKETARPGRYLYIEHVGGWTSLYIHLNDDNPGTDDGRAPWYLTLAPGIEVGAEVEAGQLIGWTGDSGNAEGANPHTHFELSVDGKTVNPYPYLEAAHERDLADKLRREQLIESQMLGSLVIV